jgi:HEAT repeat protein
MSSTDDNIESYLGKLRHGSMDAAFHGLLEIGCLAIPKLTEEFRKEVSPNVRAELVRIIWNYRQKSTIPFLQKALFDDSFRVWSNALDGLVTLASPEVIQVLREALTRSFVSKKAEDRFRKYIEEAIQQVDTELAKRKEGSS